MGMFDSKICDECGKSFLPGIHWMYKLRKTRDGHMQYYCSYKCYQKNGGDGGVRVVKN